MISWRLMLGLFLLGLVGMALGVSSLHFLYAAWHHAGL